MEMPTKEEILAAHERWRSDGPQPVAQSVDESPLLTTLVKELVAMMRDNPDLPPEQIAKTGLVYGLNIGIRVGEARRPAASRTQ